MTGLWQVSGRNKITDFDDVVKLDLKYIDSWSMWLDAKIILKTVFALFSRGSAF
jgi:lipopolysaccharide/colanic/teichoic acid biosynthesis glycosyltransferase